MTRLWRHMRALWPRWTLLPPLPFLSYFCVVAWRGEVRAEHVLLCLVVIGLAYTNAASKKLCVGSYPMGLVGLLYDAMKPLRNVGLTPERVHLCDLRAAELALFGVTSGGERMTLQDWFLTHHAAIADVYFAIPYGLYIFAALGFAIYLYRRDFPSLQRFAWGFFVLNIGGFITYHLYPAAPPWYFHAHGCVVDLTAVPNEGVALARVDRLFDMHYFEGMYRRSSDTFGAMPSLHVAYPLIIMLFGYRVLGRVGRALAALFCVTMTCAAVYLDHHWVLDVVAGLTYGVCVYAAFAVLAPRKAAVAEGAESAAARGADPQPASAPAEAQRGAV